MTAAAAADGAGAECVLCNGKVPRSFAAEHVEDQTVGPQEGAAMVIAASAVE
jgi:hypothetical protein